MKIALGFFGFMRNLITNNDINNFMNMLPNDVIMDIYCIIPNCVSEFDSTLIDFDKLKMELNDVFKHKNIRTIVIRQSLYDSGKFVKKSKDLKLPFKTFDKLYPLYPFRLLSLFYNISETCKLIQDHYDFTILTRFDLLSTIYCKKIFEKNIDSNLMYIWRSTPYINTNHAEDRCIITGINGVKVLSDLYNNISHIIQNHINDSEIMSEIIIGKYLKQFPLNLCVQYDIQIGLSPYMHTKYTSEFEQKCKEVYQKN
jgi:hypothetical protein